MPSDAMQNDAPAATSVPIKRSADVAMVEPVVQDWSEITIIRDCEHPDQGTIMIPFRGDDQLGEIKARMEAKRFTDNETWSITRPSDLGRAMGHPEFRVMVVGECWHDVERRIAHARVMGNFTAPHDPDVQRLVNAARYAAMTLADLDASKDKGYVPEAQKQITDALAPFERETDHG